MTQLWRGMTYLLSRPQAPAWECLLLNLSLTNTYPMTKLNSWGIVDIKSYVVGSLFLPVQKFHERYRCLFTERLDMLASQ
jgi:hypothetical protein